MHLFLKLSCKVMVGRFVGVVYELSCSAKLGIYIPQLDWWFMYNVFYITGSGLSYGLVFNVKVMSITCSIQTILYPALHFRSHFPGCFFLNILCLQFGSLVQVGLSVFCAFLNLFSSSIFLAMAKAKQMHSTG